jgi:YidC/Oxa1 family membrane protein insertase
MVDFNLGVAGSGQMFTNNSINFIWQNRAVRLQKELDYEKSQSKIAYNADGDFDDASAASGDKETFDKDVKWIAVRQQFFNTTFWQKTISPLVILNG